MDTCYGVKLTSSAVIEGRKTACERVLNHTTLRS